MQVVDIGNVEGCNKSFIHINNDGKQERIRATPELLSAIRDTASNDYLFYDRMMKEIHTAYEKRNKIIKELYHFITDEMVKEAFARSSKEGLELSCKKAGNNEECLRQYGKLQGLVEIGSLAVCKKYEAKKLLIQAENSLNDK